MPISEPNTMLEINEAHSDNFILVIPKLPSAFFLSSSFNELVLPKNKPITDNPENCQNKFFKDRIQREENLDIKNFLLYINDCSIPSVSLDTIDINTQFATLKRAGKMQFKDLNMNMIVSENFLNYNILLFWMYALFNPEEYNIRGGGEAIQDFFTDIYLIVTNNSREKVAEYKFYDAFPSNLGDVPLTYKSAEKLNVPITFSHSGMYPSNSFVLKYV